MSHRGVQPGVSWPCHITGWDHPIEVTTAEGDFVSTRGSSTTDTNNTFSALLPAYLGTPYTPNVGGAPGTIPADAVAGGWTDFKDYAGFTIAAHFAALGQGYAEFSNDNGATINHYETTIFGGGGGSFTNPRAARYYRILFQNRTAAPFTFTAVSLLDATPINPFIFPLAAPIDISFPAMLTYTVITAQQPDGDFVKSRADGNAEDIAGNPVFTTATLGSGGVYETDWIDTDGWSSAEIFIATDQVSGTDGIEIEFTDDTSAATPVVRGVRTFTFTAADVSRGFATYRFPTEIDGMRIRYTNGGTAQGMFLLVATMRTQAIQPQGGFEQQLNSTNIAVMTRGLIVAANDVGAYANVTRGDLGGLRVSVNEFEAAAPIKSDTGISGATFNISTSTKIVDFTALPAGTTGLQIQASGGNNQKMYFHPTTSLDTIASALFELDAGQAQYIGVGAGLTHDIFAAPASGTQRVRVMYIAGGGV